MHGRLTIAACNRLAAEAGIAPGQSVADARALLPELTLADADPVGDTRALDQLALWCGRYTPWTQIDRHSAAGGEGWGGDGGIWLDVTGATHLFGGEEELIADLVERLERSGLAARAAMADTPGAAWAMVRFAPSAQNLMATQSPVVPAGGVAAALAELPVMALRLPGVIVDGLSRLGLRRIGEVETVPRAPLVARFGEILARRLDQALGRMDEPISPKQPVPPFRARMGFPEPIGLAEDIARGTGRLLSQLAAQLDRAHQGGRAFELLCYRVDGEVRRLTVRTGRPAREPERLQRLFAQHFDTLDPGPGIEVMVLAVSVSEALEPSQIPLPTLASSEHRPHEPRPHPIPPPRKRGGGRNDAPRTPSLAKAGEGWGGGTVAVDDLVDRLAGRLGLDAVMRLEPRESHLPERESSLRLFEETPARVAWRRDRPRPVRLLARPEPVEAVALVPDHPPVLFRWRGITHRIARADGPERIAAEWWREDRPTRDYFRVEDEAGRRFWLYRDGLFGEPATPRWFLHGLFA